MNRLRTLAATALLIPAIAGSPAHAIVGGGNANPGDFPYIAQVINTPTGNYCTGTLIAPYWVLTAAHCTLPTSTGDIWVRVGHTYQNSGGGEYRRVNRFINHPDYRGSNNDVSLLELSNPITDITPVQLATPSMSYLWDGSSAFSKTRDDGIVAGWGWTTADGNPAQRLQWRQAASPPRSRSRPPACAGCTSTAACATATAAAHCSYRSRAEPLCRPAS